MDVRQSGRFRRRAQLDKQRAAHPAAKRFGRDVGADKAGALGHAVVVLRPRALQRLEAHGPAAPIAGQKADDLRGMGDVVGAREVRIAGLGPVSDHPQGGQARADRARILNGSSFDA